MKVFSGTRRAH